MKAYAIAISLMCWMWHLQAQTPAATGWLGQSKTAGFVEVYSGVSYASAQATNQFLNNLLRQPYLSSDQIALQSDRLNASGNVMGGDYETGAKLKYRIGNTAHSVLFKAADNAHFDGNWNQNAFQLAFNGNRSFAGDSLAFSPVDFSFYRFQQIALGWAYQKDENSGLSVLCSYLNGQKLVSAAINQGWVYTSSLGDTLSAGMLGSASFSDTNQNQFLAPNGSGFAIDFGMAHRFEANGTWRLTLDVLNLGLMQWSSKTLQIKSDSAIVFTGIALGDIKTVKDRLNADILNDSLNAAENDFLVQSASTTWLPGYAHVNVMQETDGGLELGAGVVARWKVNYTPYAYAIAGWRFNKMMSAYADLGYGGYAKTQVGVRYQLNLSDFALNARFGNLEALLFPSKLAGMSGTISISYRW